MVLWIIIAQPGLSMGAFVMISTGTSSGQLLSPNREEELYETKASRMNH